MSWLLKIVVDGLIGGLVTAFTNWRRDRSLEQLGYSKADRDQAVSSLNVRKQLDAVPPPTPSSTVDRLLSGTF